MKYRFSGEATVYRTPRENFLYNCWIQTRENVYDLLKTHNTEPSP